MAKSTEATFEARVNAEIGRILPSLQKKRIRHQLTFTVHLGHTDIVVGGKQDRKLAKGRLDVLLLLDDKPMTVLELKKKGSKLSSADRDQAISYARLITPMPPFVVVSNGETHKFYTTFDKEEWNAANPTEGDIQTLFKRGLECAASDKDDAVRLLLSGKPHFWDQAFKGHTREALASLEGDIAEHSKPLVKRFCIERAATKKVKKLVRAAKPLITVTGSPISGKTNVIAQLALISGLKNSVFFYIDACSTGSSLIQSMANCVARRLLLVPSATDVRHWLISGLSRSTGKRLVLLIDNWHARESDTLLEELRELTQIASSSKLSVILSLDDAEYDRLSVIPGRASSSDIGQAPRVQIAPMSDQELQGALCLMRDDWHVTMAPGAAFEPNYRHPRVLRMLLAGASPPKDIYDKTLSVLGSVLGIGYLHAVWRRFSGNLELQADIERLAQAFIDDTQQTGRSPSVQIASHGRGFVDLQVCESVLGSQRLARLREAGHIRLVTGPNGRVFAAPTLPELLAAAGGFVSARIADDLGRTKGLDAAYESLLATSESFPFGDVVGASALRQVSRDNPGLFSDLLLRLLGDEPREDVLTEGRTVETYFPDVGSVRLHFGEGTYEPVMDNVHPWLMLSHLAKHRLADSAGNRDIQLRILATIGSFPRILRRPDSYHFRDMRPYEAHDIPGMGSVLCHSNGLIEPITVAMHCCFMSMPSEMLRLVEFAVSQKALTLAYRLHIAASFLDGLADDSVAETAESTSERLQSVIGEHLRTLTATHSAKRAR